MSKHQSRREKREARILANVGSRERAIAAKWEPTIRFYDNVIRHIEELQKLAEQGINPFAQQPSQEDDAPCSP